jgi:hypothetical protein
MRLLNKEPHRDHLTTLACQEALIDNHSVSLIHTMALHHSINDITQLATRLKQFYVVPLHLPHVSVQGIYIQPACPLETSPRP